MRSKFLAKKLQINAFLSLIETFFVVRIHTHLDGMRSRGFS